MKALRLALILLLGGCTIALAQTSIGGSSAGASKAGAATGYTGSTLSNGSTISGTGGGPGPNTSNALNHGTTGNSLGATTTVPTAAQGEASTGNAINTPAANQAEENLAVLIPAFSRSKILPRGVWWRQFRCSFILGIPP